MRRCLFVAGLAVCPTTSALAQCPQISRVTKDRLPNVTHEFFELHGTYLNRVKKLSFGALPITSQSPNDWDAGYYRIISATRIHLYPPQGLLPASYRVVPSDGTCSGASVNVTIFRPKLRYTRSAALIHAGLVQTIRACKADMPDSSVGLVIASPIKKPSIIPGIITLGIGDGFRFLLMVPLALPFDKAGVMTLRFRTPKGLRGQLHFQTVLIDATNPHARPFVTTDVHTTTYQKGG